MAETRSLTEEKRLLSSQKISCFPNPLLCSRAHPAEFRNSGTSNQKILSGGHYQHQTETEVAEPIVGRVPEAEGSAHVVRIEAPRAAAHHPTSARVRFRIIIYQGSIILIIVKPFGDSPLPHIAGHIQYPVEAGALRIGIHWCGFLYLIVKIAKFAVRRLIPQG